MALRFHPDRNDGSAESRRVMQILNEAYEVLSDTGKRKEYDRFLAVVRARMQNPSSTTPQSGATSKQYYQAPSDTASKSRGILVGILAFIFSDFRITILVIGLCIWGGTSLFSDKTPSRTYSQTSTGQSYTPSSNSPKTYTPPRPIIPTRPKWVRPSLSPVGTTWPFSAGYVSGYKVRAQGGLSSVTIDNSSNSSDVFLKLVWLSGTEAIPARMCYIPAYSRFVFSSVMAGRYDVRYRDLDSGGLSKTEEFTLAERETYNGTTYSNLTMTLYKVINGNMTTESIDESDF
jgi:hypothetical protein